ncbi:MAG: glycoside hydrolase family 2 TIM barrel-domain containing protein [candidate division KSB1 bacterium]|nr:glycoside hydrolase family 2 TIM barrel-domain containing protein [candidate division KSB1 bacterium]
MLIACGGAKKENTFRSFEFRYVSADTAANGETDLKGPTAVFDLDERLKFLRNYAAYSKYFYNDPHLNTHVVDHKDVQAALKRLKPQPQPTVREQIALDDWSYLGYKSGQRQTELGNIASWEEMDHAQVVDGALHLSAGTLCKSVPPQDWRMKWSFRIKPLDTLQHIAIRFSNAAETGLNQSGMIYTVTEGDTLSTDAYRPNHFYRFTVEIDLETGRYNVWIDDELIADFVPLIQNNPVTEFNIETSHAAILDDLWGVGYTVYEHGSRTHPYLINTFMDQDFTARPVPDGFETPDYDDSSWQTVPYQRYAHGGERRRGETLYLRHRINIKDFDLARLNIESIRPEGDVYINGNHIQRVGRIPESLDVTHWLRPGEENLIAVKVRPYQVEQVRHHMSTDKWSSWFAGLMTLDLMDSTYVKDAFVYTDYIDETAHVNVQVNAACRNKDGFSGELVTEFYPWYPKEEERAARTTTPVQLSGGEMKMIHETITVDNPRLWTTERPNLYKVRIQLQNQTGKTVDDYVLTTGLRTISQDSGTFRINGEPEVLFGPLVFNQPYPLEHVSQWMFSPPPSKWVETILECKKMNSNAIRMSVHDKRMAGVNDKRLVQIGDQMGMMFIWQTPCWIREGSVKDFDFDAFGRYMQQVHNHPSIVMWQPGNHPGNYSPEWFGKVMQVISGQDPSRLISPAADLDHMALDAFPADDSDAIPGWTHPQLARGNMEQTAAYGKDWRVIRRLGTGIDERVADCNDKRRLEYLNSDSHAWFDYESEETIGMPNWSLHQGKPYYRMYSYEKDYNIGNLGRILELSEWNESQAWQALTAYEAYRKKRWLDYDGMNWCPLRGGPNTATYMKPVIEYSGEAKLSFYALQMVYQRVLAGSRNVDLVYGPHDAIPVIVMNIGNAKTVDVNAVAKTLDGKQVAFTEFKKVSLAAGRTVTDIGIWKPELKSGQYYGFEYEVKEIIND